MSWKWFSIKTLYRQEAKGKPSKINEHYDPFATLVEERIVIFKARSFDQSIKKAEKEALNYVPPPHTNPYGQKVVMRYLKACDCFEMFEPLSNETASGLEVYSLTEIVSKKIKDSEVIDSKMGQTEQLNDLRRFKFLDHELTIEVLEKYSDE